MILKRRDNLPLKLNISSYVLDFGSVVIDSTIKKDFCIKNLS